VLRALLLGLAALLALGLLVFALGLWNATRPPEIVRVTLPLPGLRPGTEVRVVLMSDLHAGRPDMPAARLSSIVAAANALRPDLILLAGDYQGGKLLDQPHTRIEDALAPLQDLRAPLGVIAIPGNHDGLRWTRWALARQGGPRFLVNAHVDVGPLVVAGVDSLAHVADPARALAGIPSGRPVLLLFHEPEMLERRAIGRPVLALAGHTQGGQIYIPGIGAPSVLFASPLPCRRGSCVLGGTPVYVTSGVGTSWLPVRFGVPPEMVLIRLVPAGSREPTDSVRRYRN
jgi:predicted MPP superfamily phosphohydrolase